MSPKKTAAELLATPDALLTRTHLRELGQASTTVAPKSAPDAESRVTEATPLKVSIPGGYPGSTRTSRCGGRLGSG